jgi:hypothetical protein
LRTVLILPLLLAVAPAHGQRPALVGLRLLSTEPTEFWLEITNVSARPIDRSVRLSVGLTRLDDANGREYAGHLFTTVDPASGRYREASPMLEPPRLVLAKGEAKAIRIEYSELRWSYPAIGTRTPDRLSDLVESGDFELSVTLVVESGERSVTRIEHVQTRILVRRPASPNKGMQLTKPSISELCS